MGKELSPTRPPSTSSDANCKLRLYPGFWLKSQHQSRSVLSDSLWLCTVHGILQARILEWAAFPFSRGSSQPRDRTQVSHIAGGFFTSWATREARASDWLAINQRMPTPWVQQFVRAAHRTQEPVRSLGYQLVRKVRGDKDDREATSAWGHVSKCF